MISYSYHKDTKELLGKHKLQVDVLESRKQKKMIYMYPNNTSIKKPLGSKKGHVHVYDEINKKWELKEDNRGKLFYGKITKQKVVVQKIGAISSDITSKEPMPFSSWDENKKEWVVDLSLLKEDRVKQLKLVATEKILKEYPQFKQINVALGLETPEYSQACKDFIQAAKNKVESKEAEILSKRTKDTVEAVDISLED